MRLYSRYMHFPVLYPVSGGSAHMRTPDLHIFFSSVDLILEHIYAPRGLLRCDRLE